MTKPDFEKIFASGGTALPLTDSQFLQGFAYLGENPPTKEEFNWLFQQLCLKMQWLNQNAGFGRWQADHVYAVGEICFSSVIGDYRFAECTVGGKSGTTEPTWGDVGSAVTDGGVTWKVCDIRRGITIGRIPALIDVGSGVAGLPAIDGSLLTGIVSSGGTGVNRWIKFSDGTMIQRGYSGSSASGGYGYGNFPLSFYDDTYSIDLTHIGSSPVIVANFISEKNKAGFTYKCHDYNGTTSAGWVFEYIAIGRWKA